MAQKIELQPPFSTSFIPVASPSDSAIQTPEGLSAEPRHHDRPVSRQASAKGAVSPQLRQSHEIGRVADTRYTDLLPTISVSGNRTLHRINRAIASFVREDLDVARLNKIHGWLWMVGRPQVARPLHRQAMINRSFLVTEQADLHLTWDESYIYIKPLPRYLLCTQFWTDYLCNDEALYAAACGFLLSYTWLVRHESDFAIATKSDSGPSLIPSGISWSMWHQLIEEFLDEVDPENPRDPAASYRINPRYDYGELRLDRLNKIYQYAPLWWYQYLFRGYHPGYYQYSAFFSRNFAWLIVVFAYITVVLTAMQVGLSLDGFKDNPALTSASYGFSVFSMVLVVAAIGLALILFIIIFLYNLILTFVVHTIRLRKKAKREKLQPKPHEAVVEA